MTTAQFFEKFDLIADAPDAVAKMRELVLHLAVQGRLVENSPGNPTTAEEIAADKVRLLRDLRIRSHPETPQPTKDDLPFPMPQSWHAVSLGDLAFSCPTSYGEDPVPSLVKAGVVKVGNIDNQGGFKGNFTERGFLAEEFESLVARQGDLMVVKSSGSAENVHSGKAALCTAEHDGKIVGTNFVLRLRPLGTPAMPEYIWRVLTSRYSRAWIEGTVQTMTYPNLKWSDFARLPIPLPPIAEQKRIVAKVDELMALCDQLEALQQECETKHTALAQATLARFAETPTLTNLNLLFHSSFSIQPSDLRKTILTLAVQGKLVPFEISDEQHSVGDHIEFQNGYAFKSTWFKPSGVRLCRNANVSHGVLDWRESAFVDDKIADEFRRFTLREGDIVLSLDRPLISTGLKVARIRKQDLPCLLLQRVAKPVPKHDQLNPAYFLLWLNSSEFIDSIDPGRSNGVPHISTRQVERLPFVLPPLAEQTRIVAKVEELMALVDALEAQQAAAGKAATHLLDVVVSELAAAA